MPPCEHGGFPVDVVRIGTHSSTLECHAGHFRLDFFMVAVKARSPLSEQANHTRAMLPASNDRPDGPPMPTALAAP